MATHKHFDQICAGVLAVILVLTLLFFNGERLGVQAAPSGLGYENRLFDTSRVHTIDIVMEDWEGFLSTCVNEEYTSCTVIIDGEAYKNTALRAKGNTSLTQVASYGNGRYSFKLEFDHYDSSRTYYGLDKLCLNNMIQDNTYLKDYLTYQMMAQMGAAAPLCSFVNISVNGEAWGLYLAVEGIEESFLTRNYGEDYGNLYKPDSSELGGVPDKEDKSWMSGAPDMENGPQMGGGMGDRQQMGGGMEERQQMGGGMEERQQMDGGMAMGSDDVLLKYMDDDPDSYSNIFDNAKTDITAADQERLIQSLQNLSDGTDLSQTVDVDAVIRYFVVHNFVLNFDSYTGSMIHNYYLYEKDGQLSMLPWDYNLAFGGFSSEGGIENLINYPIGDPVSGGNASDRPMIAWIFENEEYTQLYHQYFAEFISGYFDSGIFAEQIDAVKALISPYVAEDPTKFCSFEEFEAGIDTLKSFCLLRAESVSRQLAGTLGSTSDTQDSADLVDAGTLVLSDMGTMNMGGGKMNDMADMPEQPGQIGDFPSQSTASAAPWILFGVSFGVLAAGLLFAFLYRRK